MAMLRAAATMLGKADRRHLADPRSLHALFHKTDRKHWGDPRSLHPSWEPRTQRAAEFVPPNSRVIEFGAGNRILQRHLDSSCTYVASDLVDRGPGTLVCDLNQRPLPDLGADAYDVTVLMGVLEYLRDVPSVLDWLAQQAPVCVLSYACAQTRGYSPRGLVETVKRLNAGWMNSYREEDLLRLFGERGFTPVHQEGWENQRLFVFSQRPG